MQILRHRHQHPISLIEALTGLVAALVAGFFLHSGSQYPLDFQIAVAFLAIASIPIS